MGKEIFRFVDEDDGSRIYTDDGYCLCTRCGTQMNYRYDPDENVDYYECPACGFISIESYNDSDEDEDEDEYDYYEEEKEDEEDN